MTAASVRVSFCMSGADQSEFVDGIYVLFVFSYFSSILAFTAISWKGGDERKRVGSGDRYQKEGV